MKLFLRYILKYFIKNLLIVQLGVVMLLLITSSMSDIKNLIGHEYTLLEFIKLQLYWAIIKNNASMPLTTTVASVITIVQLMRTNEILAYVSFGGKISSISIPLISVGIVVMLFMSFIEYVGGPKARSYRSELWAEIKHAPISINKGYFNIWLMDGGNQLVHIEFIDVLNKSMQGIKFYNIAQSGQIESYVAIEDVVKEGDIFVADGKIFVDLATTPPKVIKNSEYQLPTKLFKELLEVDTEFPTSFTPTQIYNLIKVVRERGLNTSYYEMILYSKISNILAVVVLVVLTFPIVINFSRNYSITKNIITAFSVAIFFLIIQSAMLSLGYRGTVSPLVATFSPLVVFVFVSILTIRYRKTS